MTEPDVTEHDVTEPDVTEHDVIGTSSRPEYVDRVATVPFRLGRPEELPSGPDPLWQAGSVRARAAVRMLTGPSGGQLSDFLDLVSAARGELGEVPGAPVGDDPVESQANRDNDLAFGIVRTQGPVVERLVDATLAALAGVLELAVARGSGLEPESWRRLMAGFDALLSWLADPRAMSTAVPNMTVPGPVGSVLVDDALRRWVRGHHVFMVFAQAGALAQLHLRHYVAAGDLSGAVAAARTAVELMRGSEGALRYAGDAEQDRYRSEVRPTLSPPIAPPRMSGLRWRDHEALVREVPASRDAWTWLSEHRPELLVDFRTALEEAYAAHQGVCQHFVGDESPSLLAAKGSSRSAVGVLAQFRQLRLQALPNQAHHESRRQTGNAIED